MKKAGVVLAGLIFAATTLAVTSVALALPKGAVEIDPNDTFVIDASSGRFTCGLTAGVYLPGQKFSANGLTYFYTLKLKLKALKTQLAAGKGDSSKIEAKIKKLKKQIKNGTTACQNGPDGGGNTTPTPTPTPSDQTGNFDVDGNVTDAGKSTFGIPSNLSCNWVTRGSSLHDTYCSGCHGEKRNLSFSKLREKIAESPMNYSESDINDQDLCDLTAYLNRFRS